MVLKCSLILSPVPEVQEEYVNKVVSLLERDFNEEEQNDILFSIIDKVIDKRKEKLFKLYTEHSNLEKSLEILVKYRR